MAETMSEEAIRRIARAEAEETIKICLTKLGIDHENPIDTQQDMAALREMRLTFASQDYADDMLHLRRWRKRVNAALSRAMMVVIGVLVLALLTLMWSGFQDSMRQIRPPAGTASKTGHTGNHPLYGPPPELRRGQASERSSGEGSEVAAKGEEQ